MYLHGQYCYNMYVHARSILYNMYLHGQYCYIMYVHAWSILYNMYLHGQYCYNMYVHAWSILYNMYMHGQYCYNMHVQAWSVLLHGTYPGLPGSVPQIPYSLHMLTTLGRDLLGHSKGIVGPYYGRTTWDTVILYDFV